MTFGGETVHPAGASGAGESIESAQPKPSGDAVASPFLVAAAGWHTGPGGIAIEGAGITVRGGVFARGGGVFARGGGVTACCGGVIACGGGAIARSGCVVACGGGVIARSGGVIARGDIPPYRWADI